MVRFINPLLVALFLAGPSAAKELSETDFLGELPVVLTASRLAQPIQDAPNAISVIDRAMIEASGFRTVPDLFRLVPGFLVGQVNGYSFSVANAISAEYARHMQVLVDGRSIYLSSLGGVRWDTLPLAIADIDRIEVVRGPNAASYGANALTGIINIITRHPAEVEGRLLAVTLGAHDRQDTVFRWAGGDEHKHRVTLGWHQDLGFNDLSGEIYDTARSPLFNYYGDFALGPGQGLTIQAGYAGGTRGAGSSTRNNRLSLPHDEHINSHFQQIDYRRALEEGQEFQFKAYHNYQLSQETVPVGNPAVVPGFSYVRDLMSDRWHGEVQLNRQIREGLRMSLGGYGRRDAVNSQHYFNRSDDLVTWSWGAFAHAEWRLAQHWLLNTGAMWEDYDLVGGRASPRMALNWQPGPRHSFRVGVSRAYRNPVQAEVNADWRITLPLVVPPWTTTIQRLSSNPSLRPESNLSREIGYLGSWPEYNLSLDARIYQDSLRDLIDIRSGTNYMANIADSTHKGMEGQLRWRFAPHSFLLLNYAQLHIDSTPVQKQYFPKHVSGVLLSHRFPQRVDISMGHYRSDAFVTYDSNRPPSYRRTDLRIAKEFKLEGRVARMAYVLQHADGADYEYDLKPEKRVSRQGYIQFQLEF
jgi:iron complex outermembrane recepter protein